MPTLSYQPAPPAGRKTFTPPIITAMVALVVLAVITVVVVSRNSSDSTTATPPGSATASAEPSRRPVPSSDDTFTYQRPSDFRTDPGETLYVAYLTNDTVVNSTNSDDSTYLMVNSIDASGDSLEEVTSSALDTSSTTWDNIEISTPLVASIDGDETSGMTVPPYTSGTGTTIALDQILVVHHGIWYTFTALYPADSQDEARAAFIEFVESVRWTS